MPRIVGVKFRPVTKVYYFDPKPFTELEPDTRVVVETSRGMELGIVAQSIHDVPKSEIKGKLKRIVRTATPVDLLRAAEYRSKEAETVARCDEIAKDMKIPIKILNADYSFDGSRLVFAFAAEQRVDFRDLVKTLSRTFETRIEMKQVGARDETKLIDGYGRCGRRLCCSSWLTEFHPVSIRMAKNQGLPLAPAEISGLCGRLLCCLAYENEQYKEIKATMPRVNSQIKTAEGSQGTVRGVNVIKETVLLKMEDQDNYLELPAGEVEVISKGSKPKKSRKSNKPAADNQAKSDN